MTSWPSLKTDIRNAGGAWVDEEVVIDENLLTCRKPEDLPALNREMISLFGQYQVSKREPRYGFAAESTPESCARDPPRR
jgi:protease I